MRRALALGVAVVLSACQGPQAEPVAVEALDVAVYRDQVAPYVGPRCGTLDCHGVGGRPLRIYAENGLRLSAELRGEPIADLELELDAESFAGISPGEAVEDQLSLRKPLATAAGGYGHVGGDIWRDTDDPGYLCLEAWLAGSSDAAACAEAAAAVPRGPAPP